MRSKLVCIVLTVCSVGVVNLCANEIGLEGSDATAFHHDSKYTEQLFTYLQNGSSLPVLILGGVSLSGLNPGQSVLDPGYSLSGFNLSNFSAVYIESVGGCCTQADMKISATDEAAIGAAEAKGLNLSIENYGGGPAWGAILPAAVDALPSSDFGGITDFGTAGGPTCTDKEVFNSLGLSKGFTQPPVLGCYEHQAYKFSDFKALGFVSLVDADPAFFGTDGSAFLARGGPLGGGGGGATPEPSSVLLLGVGLAALGASLRKRIKR